MKPELSKAILDFTLDGRWPGRSSGRSSQWGATWLMKQWPDLEITFEHTTIDPWRACPSPDCPHLAILGNFEDGEKSQTYKKWLDKYSLAKYVHGNPKYSRWRANRKACRDYHELHDSIKKFGFSDAKKFGPRALVGDLEDIYDSLRWQNRGKSRWRPTEPNRLVSKGHPRTRYFIMSGHHRTDVAKFLKIQMSVNLIKFRLRN